MFACMVISAGLFQRKLWALIPAILLSGLALYASIINWHMPETGQLPAGVLGCTAALLLILRYREFASSADSEPDATSGETA